MIYGVLASVFLMVCTSLTPVLVLIPVLTAALPSSTATSVGLSIDGTVEATAVDGVIAGGGFAGAAVILTRYPCADKNSTTLVTRWWLSRPCPSRS